MPTRAWPSPSRTERGKQLTPNAIRAMPVTRATGIEAPASSAPSNSRPDERRSNQQRHAGGLFGHGGESQHFLHPVIGG
jgi:hypothetical protein